MNLLIGETDGFKLDETFYVYYHFANIYRTTKAYLHFTNRLALNLTKARTPFDQNCLFKMLEMTPPNDCFNNNCNV